jgi:hypothetical protein
MLLFDAYFFISTYLAGEPTSKERVAALLVKLTGLALAVAVFFTAAPYLAILAITLQAFAIAILLASIVGKRIQKSRLETASV